jgi:hypothetical protein
MLKWAVHTKASETPYGITRLTCGASYHWGAARWVKRGFLPGFAGGVLIDRSLSEAKKGSEREMRDRLVSIIAVSGFTAICAAAAVATVLLSPNPMPPANSQLFNVLIGLLSASGFSLLAMLGSAPARTGPRKEPDQEVKS